MKRFVCLVAGFLAGCGPGRDFVTSQTFQERCKTAYLCAVKTRSDQTAQLEMLKRQGEALSSRPLPPGVNQPPARAGHRELKQTKWTGKTVVLLEPKDVGRFSSSPVQTLVKKELIADKPEDVKVVALVDEETLALDLLDLDSQGFLNFSPIPCKEWSNKATPAELQEAFPEAARKLEALHE